MNLYRMNRFLPSIEPKTWEYETDWPRPFDPIERSLRRRYQWRVMPAAKSAQAP